MAIRAETYCLTGVVDAFAHWLAKRTRPESPRRIPAKYAEGYYVLQPVRLPSQKIGQRPIILGMACSFVSEGGEATTYSKEFEAIRFKIVPLAPRRIEVTAECDLADVLDYFEELLTGMGWVFPAVAGGSEARRVRATTEKIEAIRAKMGYESGLQLLVEATLGELDRCLRAFHETRSAKGWIYDDAPTLGKTRFTRLAVRTDGVSCLGGQIWYVEALDVPSDDESGTPFCIITASPSPGWSGNNVLSVNCWPDWNKGDTPASYQEYLAKILGEFKQCGIIECLPEWLAGPERVELPIPAGDGAIDLSPTEGPIGGRYGTCRDLAIDDVRAIVARCLDFKTRGGTVPEFYRHQNIDIGGPRSYELETLRGWLKNPKFRPKDTQKLT